MVRKFLMLAVVTVAPLFFVGIGGGCGSGSKGNPKIATNHMPANMPKPQTPGGAPGAAGGRKAAPQ
jgi:hypothetical protein